MHQLLRAEFPQTVGVSYERFFQVQHRNEDYEKDKQKAKFDKFDKYVIEQRGLRLLIDKILELKKPLVGHNCFTDLCYLYRTFIGHLPDTLDGFRQLLRKEFGIVIDTKFLALSVDRSLYSEISSCLQQLSEKFLTQEVPTVELHIQNNFYSDMTQDHEAGFDSWNTARALAKLSVRMYVAGSDDPPPPNEVSPDIDERKSQIAEALQTRPKGTGYHALVDLEKTPSQAKIPNWSSKFWTVFGGRLRVNGTIEGEFTI
ncbi:hypothetical protein ABW19_dt0209328 [Dactylella cylindrospora]|nr:hypothetical protein ABW19_dt0209328 [Dactylella cylindrospora]